MQQSPSASFVIKQIVLPSKVIQYFSIFFFLWIGCFVFTSSAHAANRYWVGSAGGNTNDTANWASADPASCTGGGASVPGTSDVAIFDADCDNNATINAAFSTAGINIASGYAGTITQGSGNAITLTGNYIQAGGTFTAGDSVFTVDSANFTLDGGTFTNGSGGLNLERDFTINGGTFTNTGATVSLTDGSSLDSTTLTCSTTLAGTVVITKDAGGSFTLSSGCTIDLGAGPTSAMGASGLGGYINNGTMTIPSGTWTISGGNGRTFTNNGTITHSGTGWTVTGLNLVNSTGATITYSGTTATFRRNLTQNGTFDTSGKTITFNDTSSLDDSTLTCSGTFGGTVVISKQAGGGAGDFTLSSGCSISLGASPTSLMGDSGGTYTNNGTMTIESGTWTVTMYHSTFTNNGTVTHNGSGLVVSHSSNNGAVASNFTNASGATMTYSGTTMSFESNFTQNGTFNLSGKTISFIDGNSFDDTVLTCTGTLGGSIVVTKDNSGDFTLASGCTASLGASPTTTIGPSGATAGAITNNGTLTVDSGTWTITATATGGGTFTNNGTITHSGDGWDINNTGTTAGPGSFINSSGATVTYSGTSITTESSFTQNGTFDLTGKTITFDGTASTDNSTLTCGATIQGSIAINKTSTNSFTLGSNCTIGGSFTVTAVNTFSVSAGITLTINGNWTDNVGVTFTDSTVVFGGTGQSISGTGTTTFYNLTKTVTTADTLTFAAGTTRNISNNTTLQGASGQVLSLRSSSSGTQFSLNVSNTGTRTIQYVNVQDSNNTNATIIVCNVGCVNNGNNTNWQFPWVGVVYSDAGITTAGSGLTVAVSINGGTATTGTTDSSGQFVISASEGSSGDVVAIYVDNNASFKAVAVSVTAGLSRQDIRLYKDYLIVQNNNSGSTTNANLDSADNNGDTDISALYSVSSSNLTVVTGKTLLVRSGSTYAPGGTITATNIDIEGTLTLGANAATVSGSWDATGATFTSSGTVTFTGTSVQTITSGGTSFANITFNGNGGQWNLQDAMRVTGALTITAGSLDLNSYNLNTTGGTFSNNDTLRIQGSETFTGFTNDTDSGTTLFDGTGTYSSLAGLTSFYNLTMNGSGGHWSLGGNTTVNGNVVISTGNLNASVSSYSITVAGSWTNTAATFTKQSGTVTFTGTGTINEVGSFHNLTINASGNTVTLAANVTASNNLTISAGTFDVSGNSYSVTVGGTWSNSGTFTARSGTVTLNGTNQTIAGSTTFYNLTKTSSAAVTLTFTAGTTQTVTNTWTTQGASGQLISLRSSVSGTQWSINPQGSRSLSFLDVKDSNNTNSTTVLCSSDCTNSGNNSNWAFPIVITVYSDQGSNLMGANKTVAVSVNGGSKVTATTDSNSQATFTSVGLSPGDVVGMWLDENSQKGVTATVTNSSSLTFFIYQDHLVVEHEQGSSITNTHLATVASINDSDINDIYTVSSGNVTVQTGKTLFIKSGSTYIPGGTVTTDNIDINGTFTMGSNNVTVAGNWDATGGSFTGSNSVTFTTTGSKRITSNGSSFNNVIYSMATDASLTNADQISIAGTQTIVGATSTTTEDTTAPTISAVAVTAADTKATITWTTNESATSKVEYGTSASLGSQVEDTTLTVQHAMTVTNLTADTTYSYKVVSKDSSNNSTSGDTGTFITLKTGTSSDAIAPTISNIAVGEVTSIGAQITWATNEDAVGYVNYGESTTYDRGANAGTNTYTKTKTVTITGLSPSTSYHYQIVAIDAAGNLTSSTDQTFTTGSEEEQPTAAEVFQETGTRSSSQAPTITSEAPSVINITTKSATVTWNTDERSTSTVFYRELNSTSDPLRAGSATYVTAHSIALNGLLEGTAYEYSVESLNPEGARARSKRYQFTTTLPKAAEVSIQNIAHDTAEFVYLTDAPTQSLIEITNLITGATLTVSKDDFVLDHKVSLQDLDPNTDYQAVILIKGPDGSVERSLAYLFTTREDTVSPVISSIETRSALVEGQRDVVQTIISWQTNKPTSSQVQYSEGLSESGEFKFATERNEDYVVRHVVVLPDLRPSTVYQYRVKSVDRAGNEVTSDSRVLLTPQRRVSALDLIITNLEDTFGWIRELSPQ